MDKRKLENLAKFIEKLPRRSFDISTWVNIPQKMLNKNPYQRICKSIVKHPCGTTCCIAGWEVIRNGYCMNDFGEVYKDKKPESEFVCDALEFAKNSLDLTEEQAGELFTPRMSCNNRCIILLGDKKFRNTPKGAAKMIRQFIKEKQQEGK